MQVHVYVGNWFGWNCGFDNETVGLWLDNREDVGVSSSLGGNVIGLRCMERQ